MQGSVAERSKALVLGTSLFGDAGSNPAAAKVFMFCHGYDLVLYLMKPFAQMCWENFFSIETGNLVQRPAQSPMCVISSNSFCDTA